MAAWSATIDHLWTELGSPTRYGRESGRSLIGYLSRCSQGTARDSRSYGQGQGGLRFVRSYSARCL